MPFPVTSSRAIISAIFLCSSLQSLAAKETTKPRDEAPIVRMTLYPAAEPRPALRYRLLPPLIDLRPGNAAVFYNKAALMSQQQANGKQRDQIDQWREMPLAELPREEVAAAVRGWEGVLKEVGYGAVREECDWQMPLREGFPYAIVLPEAQEMRGVARMLALKARLEIAERRYEDAVGTLRTGYALARHVARGPFYVQVLIGVVISGLMNEQARELSQQPGAPNLYWANASLPQPYIPLNAANQYEKDSLFFWHPEWRDIDRQTHDAAAWHEIYEEMVDSLAEIDSDHFGEHRRWLVLGRAVRQYSHAKRWLVERGRSVESVEQMPVAQVVVLYTIGLFKELCDRNHRWAELPFPDVIERWSADQEAINQEIRREILPFASFLSTPVSTVRRAQVRLGRQFALQCAIEALRHYAANHDGKLPAKLDDVVEMPVPKDPWLGIPFDYELSGDTATLMARVPPDMPAKHFGIHYEIKIGNP